MADCQYENHCESLTTTVSTQIILKMH